MLSITVFETGRARIAADLEAKPGTGSHPQDSSFPGCGLNRLNTRESPCTIPVHGARMDSSTVT